ncbi:DUF1134 domain-containing protein [Enterovirga aerilata]|uniref:DUF1134 domain-containing protein n=1 Tax=Enterovirga aerilata TaxID=2730920 RepID=A0A849II87_9HYPH|nr:DUF1134 domain-containing protein [Enterovirga sp. DB1703]NNM73653.1 DUF1134 domain-containing protein [Enterovirga sp. DB1703]
MRRNLTPGVILAICLTLLASSAFARGPRADSPDTFSANELLDSGHQFFGSVSRGLALAIREAVRRWGEPDGYILGQEGSGAFFGGVRYGEGTLYKRHGQRHRVFWQGPTLGFDVGGEGARTMMLVYNLNSLPELYKRFAEIDGSAYLVAGVGLTAARADDTVIVPIRTGVGLRLGVNVGYLKFTDAPTWNPF